MRDLNRRASLFMALRYLLQCRLSLSANGAWRKSRGEQDWRGRSRLDPFQT
jgi:hypothetical protein